VFDEQQGRNAQIFKKSGDELSSKRRFPRLFMSVSEGRSNPLHGVLLALPDRTHVPVLDLSVAGIVISPSGVLSQLRLGQQLVCKLKTATVTPEPMFLQLKLVRLTATSACLLMESISAEHRLKLDQTSKDRLVAANLREHSNVGMLASLRPVPNEVVRWWHGPLDTNLVLWRRAGDVLERAIIEYDGILLRWEAGVDSGLVELRQSLPASDESKGYGSIWHNPEGPRVSLGQNWRERLQKVLLNVPASQQGAAADLAVFAQILNSL